MKGNFWRAAIKALKSLWGLAQIGHDLAQQHDRFAPFFRDTNRWTPRISQTLHVVRHICLLFTFVQPTHRYKSGINLYQSHAVFGNVVTVGIYDANASSNRKKCRRRRFSVPVAKPIGSRTWSSGTEEFATRRRGAILSSCLSKNGTVQALLLHPTGAKFIQDRVFFVGGVRRETWRESASCVQ